MASQQFKSSCGVPKLTWEGGTVERSEDSVACETAVALVYNGISHVVMLVTPSNLEEFALGFSLSEGILDNPQQLLDFEVHENSRGLELHLTIASEPFSRLKQHRRNLTGRTGCGLCGAEALEQAIQAIPQVTRDVKVAHTAVQSALLELQNQQHLQAATGAVHAAAWCNLNGNIELLREDVGRHNALDKLLGAYYKSCEPDDGFVVVTSRASYEMVVKTAAANVAILVAISAPTSLAISSAKQCNVTLIGFARPRRHVVYTHQNRLEDL